MGTYNANEATVQHGWYLVDAKDKILGRLSTEIARRLRGKHKPTYTPHVDTGDYVIVVNVEKINVTGNKVNDKIYYRATSRPGSLKTTTFKDVMAKKPAKVLEEAVKGMLPKNPLGRQMFGKLKIYAGPEHPHQAQAPILLEIEA